MHKAIFALILVVAFLTRVPFLDQYPVGFTPDEASFGYDAYSLLLTGKDQWGKSFPLVLESFGDFKAPLYSYLLVPFVGIFGLEKWVVRLPNALLGVAAVFVTYLFVKELMRYELRVTRANIKKHVTRNTLTNEQSSLIASFLLAISPWHIQLSRGAFEANMTVFFLPLAMYFFLRGLRDNHYFPYAGLVFSLNLFTYHSAKLVTPLIFGFLIVLFYGELLKVKRKYVVLCGIFFFVGILLMLISFNQGAGRRAADVNIFNGALEAQAESRLKAIESGMNPNIAKLFHNQYWIVLERFSSTYSKLLSPEFLFRKGAGETTYGMLPGIPVLYPIELLFLLAFLYVLIKNYKSRVLWVIMLAILIAPIPAGLTTGVGYAANRVAIMMPFIQVASALGIFFLMSLVSQKRLLENTKVLISSIVCVLLLHGAVLANSYVQKQPIEGGKGMLVGRLEIAEWLNKKESEYQRIIVSRRLSEPHMYIAFAKKWNPTFYQRNTIDWLVYKEQNLRFLDQLYSYTLGKYVVKAIEPEDFQSGEGSLIVLLPEELPKDAKVVYSISYPNGDPSVYVVDPTSSFYAQAH